MEKKTAGWGKLRWAAFATGLVLVLAAAAWVLIEPGVDQPRAWGRIGAGAIAGILVRIALGVSPELHSESRDRRERVGHAMRQVPRLLGSVAVLMMAMVFIIPALDETAAGPARTQFLVAWVGSFVAWSSFARRRRSEPPAAAKAPQAPAPQPTRVAVPVHDGRVGLPLERPRFTIRVPDGWSAWATNDEGAVALLPEGGPEGTDPPPIEVASHPAEGRTVDDQLREMETANLDGDLVRLSLKRLGKTKAAGRRAERIALEAHIEGWMWWLMLAMRLSGKLGDMPVAESIVFEDGGWIYGVTYTAPERDFRELRRRVDELIESWRWE